MKILTKDLIGPALDWAVGDIEFKRFADMGSPVKKWVLDEHNEGLRTDPYSTDWLFGGPIIESEEIMLLPPHDDDGWTARCGGDPYPGDTPLTAAMRAFVASKMGEEVDVPEELCGGIHGL